MIHAAENGHIEIVKLCKDWGAKNFDDVMGYAAWGGVMNGKAVTGDAQRSLAMFYKNQSLKE